MSGQWFCALELSLLPPSPPSSHHRLSRRRRRLHCRSKYHLICAGTALHIMYIAERWMCVCVCVCLYAYTVHCIWIWENYSWNFSFCHWAHNSFFSLPSMHAHTVIYRANIVCIYVLQFFIAFFHSLSTPSSPEWYWRKRKRRKHKREKKGGKGERERWKREKKVQAKYIAAVAAVSKCQAIANLCFNHIWWIYIIAYVV